MTWHLMCFNLLLEHQLCHAEKNLIFLRSSRIFYVHSCWDQIHFHIPHSSVLYTTYYMISLYINHIIRWRVIYHKTISNISQMALVYFTQKIINRTYGRPRLMCTTFDEWKWKKLVQLVIYTTECAAFRLVEQAISNCEARLLLLLLQTITAITKTRTACTVHSAWVSTIIDQQQANLVKIAARVPTT